MINILLGGLFIAFVKEFIIINDELVINVVFLLLVLIIVTVVCTVATKALSTWQRSMPCPKAVGEPPIRHTGSAINEVAKALQRNARVV